MSRNTSRTRRIFGGKEPVGSAGSARYSRELANPADQAVAETLAVGTHRRVFHGPAKGGVGWSYHFSPVTAAGAASTLDFFYSNLPDPDPTNADHWVASGITQIDLTATTDLLATIPDKAPVWIKAEAVIAVSSGTCWMYVRCTNVEE